MKYTIIFSALAAFALGACTSTVSRGVQADGQVEELVWPVLKDSWRDEPLRLPSPTIAAVKVGLERKNVFALVDVPHFSEINGAREWNYIFQRPEYTRENNAVCHMKLIYDDENRVAAQYWLPEDCANVYQDTAQPYRLSADALFDFDTSTLRAGAESELVDLLAKIRAHDSGSTIIVTGYTDRLGSAAYNRRLSLARAQTVRDYLIAGGIDAGRISAHGHGSSHPVSQCSDSLGHEALIACLQPDRRVEVSVSGVRR